MRLPAYDGGPGFCLADRWHAGRMAATHEVTNQPPPLVGHDARRPALHAALEAFRPADGRRAGRERGPPRSAGWPAASRPGAGPGREREPAEAADARPLRPPGRRGGVPPGLARPDADGGRERAARARPGPDARAGRARRAAPPVLRLGRRSRWATPARTTMTYAAVPALRRAPDLAARYEPLLAVDDVRFGAGRAAAAKAGLIAGMSMTEKQGGSDVRANTTRAAPPADGTYRAHRPQVVHLGADERPVPRAGPDAGAGLSCFLLPRVLPDGTPQRVAPAAAQGQARQPLQRLQRGRVRRGDGLAGRRGGPRRPRRSSRWSTRPGWTACWAGRDGMRVGVTQAVHHARHRRAFGALLVDQPLMRNVLADLAVEREAATARRDAAGRRADRAAGRRAGGVPAAGPRRRQVLRLQAAPGARRRGAGVPGRQRLRRGVRAAPALPRGAAALDLGGLGQRRRPRRAARAGPPAGDAPRPSSPRSTRPGADRRLDEAVERLQGRGDPPKRPPAAWPSRWRSSCRAPCSSATATRRSRTPSPRPAWPPTAAAPTERFRPARPPPTSSPGLCRHRRACVVAAS